MYPTLIGIPLLLCASGCGDESSAETARGNTSSADFANETLVEPAPSKAIPEAKHAAEFRHRSPEPKEKKNGASGELTVFDHEYGVAKFVPRPTSNDQN